MAAGKLTQAQADRIKQHVRSEAGEPGFLAHPRLGLPRSTARVRRPSAARVRSGRTRPRRPDRRGRGLPRSNPAAAVRSARRRQIAGPGRHCAREIGQRAEGGDAGRVRARLDQAVSSKLITAAQEQQILTRLPARLDAEINRAGFRPPSAAISSTAPDGFPDGVSAAPGAARGSRPRSARRLADAAAARSRRSGSAAPRRSRPCILILEPGSPRSSEARSYGPLIHF